METNYKQDGNGNLILPQREWPTLSAADLELRQLLDKVHQSRDVLDYSTLSEREAATSRWEAAQRAYDAAFRRAAGGAR